MEYMVPDIDSIRYIRAPETHIMQDKNLRKMEYR